jgi:hypothetical protein
MSAFFRFTRSWLTPPIPSRNAYTIEGDIVTVDLTRGQTCRLDIADLPAVGGYRWYAKWCPAGRCFYAATHRRDNGSVMHMTSLLFDTVGLRGGECQVDHANHDTLDNRRANLRRCSQAQNNGNLRRYRNNRSGFKGVVFRARLGSFEANIREDGRQHYLGLFPSANLAARAYDAAAIQRFGAFACLNFPPVAA